MVTREEEIWVNESECIKLKIIELRDTNLAQIFINDGPSAVYFITVSLPELDDALNELNRFAEKFGKFI